MILSIEQATVRHLNKILFKDLNVQIKKGEQWAFLGESGSGKTALLHTILGHFNVVKGTIKYPELDEFRKTQHIEDPLFTNRNLMAFIKQQAEFKDKENMQSFFYQQRYHAHFSEEADTVKDYLEKEQKKMLNEERKSIKFSLQWIVNTLQLNQLMEKTLIQLSNGETRRLMIAKALLEQPLILLMDNPFIGLDTATRPILEDILKKIAQSGTTLIMATTSREVPGCITHVGFIKHKKIEQSGAVSDYRELLDKKAKEAKMRSKWEPDKSLLAKINELSPQKDHDFEVALDMDDINVISSGKEILKDVIWKVNKGEKWSLLGPNGAGKSTLLSLINGDHPQAYANKIKLFDQLRGSGESIWELKSRMGFVSPEMHQYFTGNFSINDVILSGFDDTMGVRKHKANGKEQYLADYWLKLLDLGHLGQKFYRTISSGEQRLVLLIRAMIKNPPLLILDEPCQGLDGQQREHFKSVVNNLWSGSEKTLLYVSHYKEDIPSCVTKIIELKQGVVVNRSD